MKIEIGKKVIDHLRKMPFGFPRTADGDEYKILERPFPMTDEEGELMSQLMAYPEHIDDIAKRIGRSKEDIQPLLESLVRKTWVGLSGPKENRSYMVIPYAPGTYELQVKHYSPEFFANVLDKITPDSMAETIFGPTPDITPWFRVLPYEEAIPHDMEVMPSELFSHLLVHAGAEEQGGLAQTDCQCRKTAQIRGNPCTRVPVDNMCTFLGFWAQTFVACEGAKPASKEDVLKTYQRAKNSGAVLHAFNCEHTLAICACCPCHCGLLSVYLMGVPQADLTSNFYAVEDWDQCDGKKECIKICPANAISYDAKNKKAVTDEEKCLGCGLCVLACPSQARKLERKKEITVYPHEWLDFMKIRAQQTGRTELIKMK
ncbi:MAG: 4Fe-4S binding protein [Desulfobacterales bacterium]